MLHSNTQSIHITNVFYGGSKVVRISMTFITYWQHYTLHKYSYINVTILLLNIYFPFFSRFRTRIIQLDIIATKSQYNRMANIM